MPDRIDKQHKQQQSIGSLKQRQYKQRDRTFKYINQLVRTIIGHSVTLVDPLFLSWDIH